MDKFLRSFLRLQAVHRQKFLAGLVAGFWGNDGIRARKLPQQMQHWLQQMEARKLPEAVWHLHLNECLTEQDWIQTPSGTKRNLFYHLNLELDQSLPILMQLEPVAPPPSKSQIATQWLLLGDPNYADAVLRDQQSMSFLGVDELENRHEMHLAYYNHLIHSRQEVRKSDAFIYHFQQIEVYRRALSLLRQIRMACSAANKIQQAKQEPAWQYLTTDDLRQMPAGRTIEALQTCYYMIIHTQDPELKAKWLQVNNNTQETALHLQVREFDEITRYLVNIATVKINQGDEPLFWNAQCLDLLERAFAQGTFLVNAELNAQHLVNFCRMASVLGEVQRAHTVLFSYGKQLSNADQAQGELQFCQAALQYAEQDYENAWKSVSKFYPIGRRKLAYFVLRIKIALEAHFPELETTIEAFIKWLDENKKTNGPQRYANESQRIKLIKRIVSLQYASQKRKDRLWIDIGKARIDREWLQERFIERLGFPSDLKPNIPNAETQEP